MPTPTRARRALVLIPLLVAQVGCDQATKEIAQRELMGSQPFSFLGGLLKLAYVENAGAFLGLGGGLAEGLRFWLLTVGVGIGLAAGLVWLFGRRSMSAGAALAGALCIAGGLGNFIDRVLGDGRVIDFMQMGVGPLQTGVFNVADLQIVLGVAVVLWLGRRQSREPAVETPGEP